MYNADIGIGCGNNQQSNCSSSNCTGPADFCIKRHDTKPDLKILMEDCDGVVDLTDDSLVLEASMWSSAKIKVALDVDDTTISFADNIGFDQISVGDIIIMDQIRNPEHMLITAINESLKNFTVQRSYNGTVAQAWRKGSSLKFFKFMDSPASIESVFGDVMNTDGTTTNQLLETYLVYNWSEESTSLPGCYFLEFKLMKISEDSGEIEWTKRFPATSQGFIINIVDTPTIN